jgi:hypothetical protein
MWEALTDRLDNVSKTLCRTQVLQKFTASQPSPDEMVTLYLTKSISFHTKLIGTPEYITDEAIKIQIFTTRSKSYETTIQILEQRTPAPTAQQCMDVICEYAE